MMAVSVDRASGVMNISVTTSKPLLSVQIARNLLDNLIGRIREIETKKARENLAFIRERFQEVQQELMQAEEELVLFIDSNQDVRTAKLRTELERYQRNVTFKTQLYGDLQGQMTQAEIELQRSNPVLTVIEAPVLPVKSSGPRRKLTVLMGMIIGLASSVGFLLIRNILSVQNADEETRAKLAELREAFSPRHFTNWVQHLSPFRLANLAHTRRRRNKNLPS